MFIPPAKSISKIIIFITQKLKKDSVSIILDKY